ncbi:E1 [Fulmarus glacialis papillomavirus 1]|uniref:Replication protein E1 n=1 Tax=Fulmarus glacialis papillomavirus 1 TaxID=1463817 RepID=A0A059TB07_9PAPI|nr:E1 [Fulmarus glacialis papillomavirus 1]AHV82116.1 E1 [Fulmarus glacialis papillomavirus 1]
MTEFLDLEAEASSGSEDEDEQDTGINTLSELFESDGDGESFRSGGSTDTAPETHRIILHEQMCQQDREIIQGLREKGPALKRACPSTPLKPKRTALQSEVANISPRLQGLRLNNGQQRNAGARKRIGYGSTEKVGEKENDEDDFFKICAKFSNARMAHLARFKEQYGLSFSEVTRPFKSDRTQNNSWVVSLQNCYSDLQQILLTVFKKQCINLLYDVSLRAMLMYCEFNASKCRDGIKNLLKTLDIDPITALIEPPNIRNQLCGMFWKRLRIATGGHPDWVVSATTLGTKSETESFELTEMVQWAMDHSYTDEATIAYRYAQLAPDNRNAELWLKSNSQAKYLKDCVIMVRNYLRAQLHAMTMSEYISSRCDLYDLGEDRGYKKILKMFAFQGIIYHEFLMHMTNLLHAKPKKSALAFVGVPDSGKSMICMSLIKFLNGKVLSFCNSHSHFWLQPLADAKLALIDDATEPCWTYIDTYLRTALDGSPISLDMKHRAPMQIKCPPLLITSNTNISESPEKYKYLLNRITLMCFTKQIPVRQGQPVLSVDEADWKSFFIHFWGTLNLDKDSAPDGADTPDTSDGAERNT